MVQLGQKDKTIPQEELQTKISITQNSSYLLPLINRSQFYALIKSTQSDKYCKKFSTWQQLVTMCYAKIANHNGPRSLINSLNASGHCRYHLGIHKELTRSTLSYANNYRSAEIFEKLFYALRNTLDRGIFIQ